MVGKTDDAPKKVVVKKVVKKVIKKKPESKVGDKRDGASRATPVISKKVVVKKRKRDGPDQESASKRQKTEQTDLATGETLRQKVSGKVFERVQSSAVAEQVDDDAHPLKSMSSAEAAEYIRRNMARLQEYALVHQKALVGEHVQMDLEESEQNQAKIDEFCGFLRHYMSGVAFSIDHQS